MQRQSRPRARDEAVASCCEQPYSNSLLSCLCTTHICYRAKLKTSSRSASNSLFYVGRRAAHPMSFRAEAPWRRSRGISRRAAAFREILRLARPYGLRSLRMTRGADRSYGLASLHCYSLAFGSGISDQFLSLLISSCTANQMPPGLKVLPLFSSIVQSSDE